MVTGTDAGARIGQSPPSLMIGELEFRPGEWQLLIGGKHVPLTRREFQLLFVLAESAGRVVQRPALYTRVWGGPMGHRDRSVDVFVRKIRRKLGEAAPDWTFVHTHFGFGYRFSPERNEAQPAT